MPQDFSDDILQKLSLLQAKFAASGQDLGAYLEGLLHADYLTYWDYIQLDTLLSLQRPLTRFPDEEIFILYHQVTELYFKLVINELNQLDGTPSAAELLKRVGRINRYFSALTDSFGVMVDGMDPDQFLKFRMALLPASGFQSAQYRKIEIRCTSFDRLLHAEVREAHRVHRADELSDLFEKIYWKSGAVELSTGEKTLTLRQFEAKYGEELLAWAQHCCGNNLAAAWQALPETERSEPLREALRTLDAHVNINWPLAHYKSAVRYLQKDPADIAATGGTNWQKYLPPRFQRRVFFPELWTLHELEEWGKSWVKREVFGAE